MTGNMSGQEISAAARGAGLEEATARWAIPLRGCARTGKLAGK